MFLLQIYCFMAPVYRKRWVRDPTDAPELTHHTGHGVRAGVNRATLTIASLHFTETELCRL